MEYKKQIIDDLTAGMPVREQIVGQSILGSKKFIWVRQKYIANEKGRKRPDIRKNSSFFSMDAVLAIVEQETGISQVLLATGTTRQIIMTALYNFAGLNNREIGDIMGVDYSTVSQARKRLRDKAYKDSNISQLIECLNMKCQG